MSTTSAGGDGCCRIRSARLSPSMYCMTMKTQIVFFADFVDGADVGMVQCGSRPGLVHQPVPGPIARLGPLGQHFDRNHAAERGVFREEDLTHPARAQLSDDSVVADL